MSSLTVQLNDAFFEPSSESEFSTLVETGVIDPGYTEAELPQSFFSEIFSAMQVNSDTIVLKKPYNLNGKPTSILGIVENGEPVLGASEREIDRLTITPSLATPIGYLNYGLIMDKDNRIDMPHLAPADIELTQNALAKPVSVSFLEQAMSKVGFTILNPSYETIITLANHQYISYRDNKNLRDQLERKVGSSGCVFSARSDLKKWKSIRNCYLEFNPYHPAAIDYIVSVMEDKEHKVTTGKFRWGRSEYDFCYEWMPDAYRVYSDVWGSTLKQMKDMIVFNIRGNFDFAKYFPQWKSKAEKVPFSYMAYTMLEYDMLAAEPVLPYAITNTIYAPGPLRIYSRHITKNISATLKEKKHFICCKDVTRDYIMRVSEQQSYEVSVVNKSTGVILFDIMKGDKKTRFKGTERTIFVEYSVRTNNFRVWKKVDIEQEDCKYFIHILASDGIFYNVPRNAFGCIVYPPDVITLTEYYKRRLELGIYMMASVPYDDEEEMVVQEGEPQITEFNYLDIFESGYVADW